MSSDLRRNMVVDDDASMGQAIVCVLGDGGFAATMFASAETALEADVAVYSPVTRSDA
jgi:FixJ family two-component response regulator